MKSIRERRAYPRLTEKQKIQVRVASCDAEKALKGRTFSGASKDISVGGVQFYARRTLPVGTEVDVRIELSRPHEVFNREGRVIWSQQATGGGRVIVGVHFSDKDRDTMIAWRRMLTSRG